MEAACRLLADNSDAAVKERGLGALTRAMVQLPAYLDRLLGGNGDVALVLLPLVNDLRELRGEPSMSEGTLLLLNSGPFERSGADSADAADTDFGPELARAAQALRPTFQSALLGLIRGDDPQVSAAKLLDVAGRLEHAAQSDAGRDFWSVVGGVMASIQSGALEASVALKRLVGQVDRQLKQLIDDGERVFAEDPPAELLNSLLYYIACAKTDDTRILALRDHFELADIVPDEAKIEAARENLSGPSIRLMQTVSMAISEDLSSVKDALDIFVRTGMENGNELSQQVDLLRKIGDTLGVLGLEPAQAQIHREAQTLDAAISAGDLGTSGVLESVAATLLDVEDTLGRELVRIAAPLPDVAAAQAAGDGAEDDSDQYRHVAQAVMNECIVNLAKVKEAVARIVEDPSAVRVLDTIPAQLRGITAGLLMLNKTRAVRVVERVGQVIATRFSGGGQALKQSHLERLADAIVSVEYYMETLSIGRGDPWYMLDNAQRCLDLLDRLQGGATPAEASGAEADRAPDQIVPTRAAPEPADPAKPTSVMELDEERSEPELVEIFIEEAKEELGNINRYLPVWAENHAQTDALIAIRRSFHTLKGSGRMIGAKRIGEFAWSVENLLNRVINQTLPVTPQITGFIRDASDVLPALIEQLEIGSEPQADIDGLMARANQLATGDVPAAQLVPTGPDPVLTEIFAREVRTHLATLRSFLDAQSHEASAVDEAVYRASHTLLGSARMANVGGAIALAEPLEQMLAGLRLSGRAPKGGPLQALASAADEFERLADTLEQGERFEPTATVLAALTDSQTEAEAAEDAVQVEPPPPPATNDAAAPAAEAVSESYDPDIAAIFAEEAMELLEKAETAVQDLGSGNAMQDGLRELQRLLHTIKGGARMAGIMTMGDLSHALESLLAAAADGLVEFDQSSLGLVRESLDQLQQMRDTVDAGQPVAGAPDLITAIEAAARRDASVDVADPAVDDMAEVADGSDAPVDAAAEEHAVDIAGDTDSQVAGPDRPPADAGGNEDAETAEEVSATLADSSTDQPAEDVGESGEDSAGEDSAEDQGQDGSAAEDSAPGQTPALRLVASTPHEQVADQVVPDVPAEVSPAAAALPRGPDKADTARVSAELLDELLNHAGEVSIFQSRLAQQLQSIDFHLGELGQTVTRLGEQLRSLESETEAQILYRHQDEEAAPSSDFDPLELDRYSTIQQLSRALAETSNDVASINELLTGLTSETETLLTQQARVAAELQDGLMQTRMVPVSRQVPRLQRIVRQAASDSGKQAELDVEGADSLLDRQVLESVLPALEHILRNAVAHGIETPQLRETAGKPPAGTVHMAVKRDGAEAILEIADDGAGLDIDGIRRRAVESGLISDHKSLSDDEAIDLIMRPGFTTAEKLTQAAGRGVGMDVVDNEIKKLGGSMRIGTQSGHGTRFVIRLPFTLAITHALIVRVGDETFALPLPTVEGITRVRREQLLEILTQDDPILSYGDANYRVQHLGSLVGGAPSALPEDDSAVSLVLVRAGENSAALLTDSLEGSREIVVKTLGAHLSSVSGVSGATILGDGRVTVILDAPTLVRAGGEPTVSAPAAVEQTDRQLAALVVDDSITMRRVTERLLERRGMRVLTARDGLDAIEVLQEGDVDIIVLDIEMPRMDGYQFASHVRNDARLKDTPIIMVTSRSGEKHRAKAIEVGVNDYLSKPYQESRLIAAVESLLGTEL